MKKGILLYLMVFCVLKSNAQIKAQREYDYVGIEENNADLRVVGIQGYFGCINKEGDEIVPLIYSKVKIGEDFILVGCADYKKQCYNWGLLSVDGRRTIIPMEYSYIAILPKVFKKYGCTIVRTQKGNYGVISKHGDIIVSLIYKELYWIDESKGLLAACLNGLWGVINYKGVEVLPFDYYELDGQNGFAISKNSEFQLGFIDMHNNIIIPYGKYDDLSYYNGVTMWAKKDDKYALINQKDEVVIPFKKYKNNGIASSSSHKEFSNSIVYRKYYGFGDSYSYSHNYWNVKRYKKYQKKNLSGWRDDEGFFIFEYIDDKGIVYHNEEDAQKSNEVIRHHLNILNDVDTNNNLAALTWFELNNITYQQKYELSIGVKSDSKIEDVTITVNGIQDRGIKTVNSSDYDLTINRTLRLNEGANVIKVSVRNAAGTAQEEKTIVYRPQGGELPSIEWLDFAATANKKEYQIRLGIKSKSKVEEVNVTVNGALTRGIKTVESDGYDLTVDRTLALSEGLNRIVVSVRNGDGISTSEKVITYQGNNPTPVFNDKRIAFVIGNSHYSNSEMNLANPENDAKDVAEKLKGLGFEVVLKLDATLEDMDKGLSSFREKAKEYDVAMFYYAGHGIQSKGVNYLIPTNINNLAEDNMKYKCVDMERVLDVMEDSKCKLKIVILDACRNDPLSRRWHRSAGTRGLSLMNAPTGTIISFSTAPGSTALDGKGRNSPYTEAFLNTLAMPNLDVFHFFQKVGASVLDKTQRSQNPWLSVSFTGDFYFNKQ